MNMFVYNANLVVRYSIDLNGYITAKYLSMVIAVNVRQYAWIDDLRYVIIIKKQANKFKNINKTISYKYE